MQLKLKNIGMIKEADITINGLTVIAGENDTGKSTVGKALYLACIYSKNENEKIEKLLFDIENPTGVILIDGKTIINKIDKTSVSMDSSLNINLLDVMMIETPVVWNFFKFFNAIEKVKTEASFFDQNYDIPYPYLMWDIYKKLSLAKNEVLVLQDKNIFLEKINQIIDGRFAKDSFGDFIFLKGEKKIPIINTATGIKQFGILQKLIENNYIHNKSVIILDEPEVHLHPKWQLKMAELIVELVKNGVKVVVNSHSPYMIEALQRYSDKENVNSNFYLAQDGFIKQVEDSNAETLSKIFEKLSEPFDVFEKMDSDSMEQLIHG